MDSDATKAAVYFSYDALATPDWDASLAREKNWRMIQVFAEDSGVDLSRHKLDPYSMGALEDRIAEYGSDCDEIAIDLSCFTKLHLMAIARAVLKLGPETAWSICYSSPYSYGNLNVPSARGGWQGNIFLSLGDDPTMARQGTAVGILLAGMEADRAAIAMNELEPASGLIVVSCTRGRPDMHRLAVANNSLLFSHLRQLRMPGPLGKRILSYFPSGGWEVQRIYIDQAAKDLPHQLSRVVRAAKSLSAPIILFPFGPKLVNFVAALYLARNYPIASWAIYPVPKTHPLDYSEGTRITEWYDGRDMLLTLNSIR